MKTVSQRIQTLQKKLDRLIQQHYVSQYPKCLVCGNPTDEMHHFIQKRASTYLRYEKRNLVPLCKSCHCKHHQSGDPKIVTTIVHIRGRDWFNWIESHRHIVVKRNLAYLKELKDKIKQLQ